MRERALLIGAELSILSPETGGTEIVLRVPLQQR
jgi:signal transduction histidine kinase